jgi:hypothetical protein
MSETKTFSLRTVLTVTTGRLLTKPKGERDNGIGDLYELLGWMTNDSPFTHQLGRFAEECKPWLLRWFPNLQHATDTLANLDKLLKIDRSNGVELWLKAIIAGGQPSELEVPRIPRDDHTVKDAYDELVEMRGTDEGIELLNPNL